MHFTAARSRFEQRNEATQPLLQAPVAPADQHDEEGMQLGAPPEPPVPIPPAPQLVFPPASHAVHNSLPPPVAEAVSPASPQAPRQPQPQPQRGAYPFGRPPITPAPAPAACEFLAQLPEGGAAVATPAPPALTMNFTPHGSAATSALLPRMGSAARARTRTRTPGQRGLSASADCAALAGLGYREPIVSSDDNLKVVVRVRPMNERELDAGVRVPGAAIKTLLGSIHAKGALSQCTLLTRVL